MPAHSGPVTAVMLLLLLAGAQKIIDPSSTSGALRSAGLPDSPLLVRLLGFAEMGAGTVFLVWGGRWAPAMAAALYAGFAWFVVNALVRKLPISSCGCLGSVDTPPTMVHVVMNVSATVVLLAAVIIPIGPLGGMLGADWRVSIPYVLLVGISVYMLYALLTVLPLVSRRNRPSSPTPVVLKGRGER